MLLTFFTWWVPGPLISKTQGRPGSEIKNVKNKQKYKTQVTFIYTTLFDMKFIPTPVLVVLYFREQSPLNFQILPIPLIGFQVGSDVKKKEMQK